MHLSMAEDGAYCRALDLYYTSEKPLDLNLKKTFKKLRANSAKDKAAVRSILRQFFKYTNKGYVNNRAEEEITHRNKKTCANKENGKLGGRPRTQQEPNGLFQENPLGLKKEPYPAPAPEPYPSNSKSTTKATPRFACPAWIRNDSWDAFEEMRRKIRAPLTDRAREGIIRNLEKLRATCDPNEVLLQSVTHAWRGVFQLRGGESNGKQRESFQERQQRENKETIDRVAEKYS